jgi:hypothetical protein
MIAGADSPSTRRSPSGRHLPATVGARPAQIGAPLHLLVSLGHRLAMLGTLVADLRTHPAGALMVLRSADHEGGAGGADLGAIHQEPDVALFGMLAPLAQAVRDGLKTDTVTIRTVLNALLHVHGRTP